jgi:uncharacterized protein YeaO (DUF488 family)
VPDTLRGQILHLSAWCGHFVFYWYLTHFFGGGALKEVFLKRVYEPFDEADGCRILIDRLWPRGISKEEARLSYWLKDVSPSSELRKWFGHIPERFEEFQSRYLNELQNNDHQSKAVEQIIDLASKERVTLLYGAKDPVHNQGKVLLDELARMTKSK